MQRQLAQGLTPASLNDARNAFRTGVAGIGDYRTQTVRAQSATASLTESIIKQNISLKDRIAISRQYNSILSEQLQLQRMLAVQWTQTASGAVSADVIIPRGLDQRFDALTNSLRGNLRQLVTNRIGTQQFSDALTVLRTRIGLASAVLSASGDSMIKWGKNTQWAGRQLMVGFTVPMAAFGAIAGKAAYDVDKEMTRITKVYDTTATTMIGKQQELDALRTSSMNMATQAARVYGSTIKNTLSVEADLAATGLKGSELTKGTTAVIRAATLGEMDYQDTVKASIALQSVYGMNSEQLGDAFNYLNALENATNLSMKDMVQVIPRASGPLKSMNVSLQDTGVLMAAMKAAGIDATIGANALKGGLSRILNPSKEVQKSLAGFGISIEKIVQQSGGDFMKILEMLAEKMNGLDRVAKQQVIAKLFAGYNYPKILAVIDGLGQIHDKQTQVGRAYEVSRQSTEQWGDTAQGEMDKIQQSASGKFKRAIASIQAQMAEVGKPFLEIGASVLGFIKNVLVWFNKLPSGAKKTTAIVAIVAAISGPIIMLTGLFINLMGQAVKMFGVLGSGFARMRPMTAEMRAQQMLSERSATAWANQGNAAQALAGQLSMLTSAMERTAVAQMNLANPGRGIVGVGTTTPSTGVIGGIGPTAPSTTSPYQQLPNGRYRNVQTGRFVSTSEANAYAAAQASAARSSAQIATTSAATGRNWGRIITGVGALAVVGSTFMAANGSSHEMLNNIIQMVAMAALLGPTLVGSLRSSRVATAFSAMTTAFTGGRAGASGVAGLAGGFRAALPAAGQLLMVALRFAGVIGAVVGAIYIFAKMYGAMKKNVEEQDKINKSANDWANILGFVYEKAGEVNKENNKTTLTIDAQVTKLKEANGALVEQLQLAKQNKKEQDVLNMAINEGLKTRAHGGSVTQAEEATKVSLRAAGYTSTQIETLMIKVKAMVDFSDAKSTLDKQLGEFATTFAQVANNKFKQTNLEGFGRVFSGRGDINQRAAKAAQGMADEFWNGFQKENDDKSRLDYFNKFFQSVQKEQKIAWGRLGTDNRKDLAKVGIDSWKSFAQAWNDNKNMNDIDFRIKYGDNSDAIRKNLASLGGETQRYAEKHIQAEQSVAREIAKKNNMSDKDIKNVHSLSDLYGKLDMATMTVAQAQTAYSNAMIYQSSSMVGLSKSEANAFQLKILNQYRMQAGLSKATSLEQGFKASLDSSTDSAKKNANAIADVSSSVDDYNNARQKAMSGAQDAAFQAADDIWTQQADAQVQAIQDRASKITDALDAEEDAKDASFDKRADNADKRFDRRSKALDARWDNIMDKFDTQWDARMDKEKNAYDTKIKQIQDEVKAEEDAETTRQKIFEAEKTRMQRMADIANQRIDFNLAVNTGNLDEAAKVFNNIQSTQDSWTLDDAAASSQSQSDARKNQMNSQVDALEAARDKRLDDLKKVEDAEKKALDAKKDREQEALKAEKDRYDKSLQAERDRYRKGIEAHKKAITEDAQRDADALRAELNRRKQTLDLELAAIKANVPRNKKEYDAQIAQIEAEYKKYGVRLKNYGNSWSNMIGIYLRANVKTAANGLSNDINWKQIASQITSEMIDGGFGMTTSEFMKWVTTGSLPKGYQGPGKKRLTDSVKGWTSTVWRHKGGPVGGGHDSRGGRSWSSPMQSDETMGVLKKDEYVINGNAHRSLGTDFLDQVNNGKAPGVGGASPQMGMAGIFAALLAGAFSSFTNRATTTASQYANTSGSSVPGDAGKYADINLDSTQLQNAATIIGVGKSMGATNRDLIVSIMTAMQESGLRNVNYGDRDSLGLFQQRPSQGWGTPEQIMNPSYSAKKFFQHLLAMKGRNKLSLAAEAQAVQRSAFPDAYAHWQSMAEAVVAGTGFMPVSGGGNIVRPLSGPVTRTWANHPDPKGTDIGVPKGTPVHSAMAGRVVTSMDLRGNQSEGYRSYGRYVVIDHGGGRRTLYGHMSNRLAHVGDTVGAGQVIGISGNTGNSTGPHLHFETWMNNRDVKPGTFGVPGLKTGGFTLSNGLAQLHKNETVLTAPLSNQLKEGIQRIDQGITNDYNITIDLREAYIHSDVDVERAVNVALDKRESKMGRNRKIK
jgi:TP901 family phage tail tape measure protein